MQSGRFYFWPYPDLPYISTLRWHRNPPEHEFVKITAEVMKSTASRSAITMCRFQRHVVIKGQDVGQAALAWLTQDRPSSEIWVRPYFDPATGEIRLQGKDGLDIGPRKHYIKCAADDGIRPILRLAHAEGLLDKLPGPSIILDPCQVAHFSPAPACSQSIIVPGLRSGA